MLAQLSEMQQEPQVQELEMRLMQHRHLVEVQCPVVWLALLVKKRQPHRLVLAIGLRLLPEMQNLHVATPKLQQTHSKQTQALHKSLETGPEAESAQPVILWHKQIKTLVKQGTSGVTLGNNIQIEKIKGGRNDHLFLLLLVKHDLADNAKNTDSTKYKTGRSKGQKPNETNSDWKCRKNVRKSLLLFHVSNFKG
jgi:hypothetical protein